jgi:hypothetical protein
VTTAKRTSAPCKSASSKRVIGLRFLRKCEDREAKVRELFYNHKAMLFQQFSNCFGAEVVNVTTPLPEVVVAKHPAVPQTV